jgi:hypothetical protein
MQTVTTNPRDALVVAKVLRRHSSLQGTGDYLLDKNSVIKKMFPAEELALDQVTAPETVTVEASYRGPQVQLPINKGHFEALLIAFQRGEV